MRNLIRATIFLSIAAAFAQQPPANPEPPLILKSTTRLVQISVIATRKGDPAEGLKKEDFTVTDNGKVQPLTLFSVESNRGLPATNQPLPPNTFSNRVEQKSGTPSGITIILFDSLNTRFSDRAFAREQIVKYLKTIQPGERIGLYALGRGIRVLHDYTIDSTELLARLNNYHGGELPNLGQPGPPGMDPDALQLDAWLSGRGGMSGAEGDFYTINRVRGTLRSLQFIADHLSRVPGRKNLIWVSGGFPLTLNYDNINAWSDPRRQQATFTQEITECVRAMNNANLAVYPVDARGLMPPTGFSAEVSRAPSTRPTAIPRPAPGQNERDAMAELADRTGGRAYYNTNDLTKAIRESVNDTRLTYTLGYYPNDDKFDGKFHNIKVKVDQSGVSLRYRKGYFDLPEQPQNDQARKLELRDAVFSPLDATEIGITAEVKAAGTKLELVVHLDPKEFHLEQQADRWAGKLDFLFVQKDAKGRQFNGRDDTLELRLTEPRFKSFNQDGMAYRQIVDRAPQATEIRIVVRDAASGAMGSVTVPFTQLR